MKLLHRKLLKISRKTMFVTELPFNKIVRLYSTAYCRIKKPTIDAFLELQTFSRSFENFGKCPGKALLWSSFSKLQVIKLQPPALPCMFLKFWKILEITFAVELLFQEAGANRFSTRDFSKQF